MTIASMPARMQPPDEVVSEYRASPTALTREVTVRGQVLASERQPRAEATDDEDGFTGWWDAAIRGPKSVPNREAPPLRFMDLFSSVGGLSLGAMDAISSVGRKPVPVLAADVDSRALQVYKANIRPREVVADSVRGMLDFRVSGSGEDARFAYRPSVTDERLAAQSTGVDLILAGPPCQGHSSLNNYSRHEDPKNLLYLTVPAAAVALGARHVVIENVPNVVADRHGVVQTTIALLRAEGYQVTYGVLRADRIGWPQTRKRFFLVASRDSAPADLNSLGNSMARKALPVTWLLDDLIDSPLDDADVMNSVPRLSLDNETRVNWLFDHDVHNLPNEIRPDCHKNGTTYSATYGRMHAEQPAPTITGGFLTPGRGRFVHPLLRRVMTPREAARVQGFPDWFDFVPNANSTPSRTEVSRWIGNAVPSILGYVATLAAVHDEGKGVSNEVAAYAA